MFTITKIKENEIDLLLEFIKKLALYEERLDQVTATPKDLRYYIFDKKTCEAIFLREDNQVIGFALYFYNFSTFLGKAGLYLEDLFILPEHRKKGYGKQVFSFLEQKKDEENLGRIEWTCLDWNESAIKFYKSLGAKQKKNGLFLN